MRLFLRKTFAMNLFLFVIIVTIVGSESQRRRVSPRDWPEDQPEYEIINLPKPPKPVWSCSFETHDCGITNDPMVGPYFKLTKGQNDPIFGKKNLILLNITDIDSNSSGARLITPYFQTKEHSKGCLTIDYMIRGNGVKDLAVYQQETQNRCLWNAMAGSRNSRYVKNDIQPNWRTLYLTIDLQYGSPRFFIQSLLDNRPPNYGFVAISSVNFFFGKCERSDANNCGQTVTEGPDMSSDYPNDYP